MPTGRRIWSVTTEHDPETLAVLREMAVKIAAAAPKDWRRAVLEGFADGTGSGHRGPVYEPRSLEGTGSSVDLHYEMCLVHELERAADRLTIELVVHPTGKFEAVTSESLRRSPRTDRGGFTYLLRPDALPAEPAAFQPGPARAVQAGDPLEALQLLDRYLRRRAEIVGLQEKLPEPLEAAQREFLEGHLPVPLPDDLRALYGRADGDHQVGLLGVFRWLDLTGLAALSDKDRPQNRWWVVRDWDRVLLREVRYDTHPAGAVRRAQHLPGWIPFAHDTGGECLAVDMDPGPNGHLGQVIRIGLHDHDGPVYVADSVTNLLRRHVEALENFSYQYKNGRLRLFLGDDAPAPDRELRIEGNSAPLREIHPGIQRLVVANSHLVDLTPVRNAPSLWEVELANCPTADLSPLRCAPLEVLTADLDRIDLAPLAEHPTLRLLKLATGEPVDLTPLRTCPRLYGLDLAAAEVRDIAVLGDLDGLLYLNLNAAQWEELWAATTHPVGLAAAELHRAPTLRKAAKWAGTLADDSPDVRYTRGRFTPPKGSRTPLWRRIKKPWEF
ncbi:SMI1/KNR4 family protein [Saccharopolyspora sp. NPDC000995]